MVPAATNDQGSAPGGLRDDRVMPRKLGHAVLGSTDYQATEAFFVTGLGFKVSDHIKGAGTFMRCSTDHHNVLVLAAPVSFLHYTSWQVDDSDAVGRGACAMLANHPDRHVWGLGRHYGRSNFFWYLKDPAGNFSEYYSDMDCIIDDRLWTSEDLEGAQGLYSWGPPPPPVGFQNSAIGADLGFYAARSYSLMRPPRMGQRWIRFWERSATGWSGRGGWSWRLRWGRRPL
jgi:catechol 2,3-dioxygenase-like lactoylglutathione lyase family enzyme